MQYKETQSEAMDVDTEMVSTMGELKPIRKITRFMDTRNLPRFRKISAPAGCLVRRIRYKFPLKNSIKHCYYCPRFLLI